MNASSIVVLFILLALLWVVQLALTYRQMRRFYRRLRVLRQDGLTAVGMGGSRYGGRAYAVLVVDAETRHIMHAEKLMGMTIFAGLKPIPGLRGQPLAALLEGRLELKMPGKLRTALLNAANDLQNALDAPPAAEAADDDEAGEETPAASSV